MLASRLVVWMLCATSVEPAAAQTQPEPQNQPVVLEGEAEVQIEDHATFTVTRYFLHEAGRRHELRFGALAQDIRTGDWIRVHGRPLPDGTLALNGTGGTGVETLTAAAQSSTVGAQKAIVILVNFTTNPSEPYSVAQAQSVMNSVSTNYWQSSYHQVTVEGASTATADVTGWHTIGYNTAVCNTAAIATAADAAATTAGFDLSKYAHKVYEFPTLAACGWQGLATTGGTQMWINGIFTPQSVGHEMGHNLGLYHANAYDCGTVTLGPSCTTLEYTNRIDLMGNTNTGDFDLFGKELIGWINAGLSPPLTLVESSGTYSIGPYEAVDGTTKGLKILKSGAVEGQRTYYYVEFRQPLANDAFLAAYTNIKTGVVIGMGSEATANSNLQLDMTPANTSWNDAALTAGHTFVDPDTGLTIQTVSISASGATVAVTLHNYPPTATVSLNTTTPQTNDILTATAATSDPNGDPVTLTYVWKVAGAVKKTTSGTSSLTDTFDLGVSGQGDAGQQIVVEVTPADGTVSGTTASATVTVQISAPQNVAPTATVSLNTTTPGTNATLTATATKADANGDTVTLTYVWKVNGVTKQTTSGSSSLTDSFNLNTAGNGDAGDIVRVEVTPSDGTVSGALASAAATVQATAPPRSHTKPPH